MPDLSIIFDMGVVALRFLMPVYAIIIVYQCFAAMRRRRRPETPLISLLNPATGEMLPVLFWENSIGRSKSSDVTVDDPTVSRNHCVLLRRKDGWYVSDTDSKSGTMLNGKRTRGRAKVLIDDTITIGGTSLIVKRGEEFQQPLQSSWFFSKVSDKPAMKSWKLMLLITFFHFFKNCCLVLEFTFAHSRIFIFECKHLVTDWLHTLNFTLAVVAEHSL